MKTSTLTKHQKKVINRTADGMQMSVTIRHDDECGNGHNTFAVTLDAWNAGKPKNDRNWIMGGCCHDEVRKYFPEIAHLIRWHLCSTDGPMHYLANTIYQASDRDCWGRRKGEPCRPETHIQFGAFPIPFKFGREFTAWLQSLENFDLEIMAVEYKRTGTTDYKCGPKFTYLPFSADTWHTCPFDSEQEAQNFLLALQNFSPKFVTIFTEVGEGKEPDLDAARRCAIWPDATLEQLQDKDALQARLPALLEAFAADVESIGMVY